jgi:hypothetical protein
MLHLVGHFFKRNIMKTYASLLAIAISVLSVSGCSSMVSGASDAGTASVDYVMGIFKADIQATPSRIAEATKRAFGVYSIAVKEYRTTELDAIIVGYTASEKKIEVTVKRETESVSELSIHIGVMGEETFSHLLYEEIKRQLAQGGTSGVTTYAVPMAGSSPTPVVPTYEAPSLGPTSSGY